MFVVARVWTLTDRLCTRTFRVCAPTLLKSKRFAAQRGSDPLISAGTLLTDDDT